MSIYSYIQSLIKSCSSPTCIREIAAETGLDIAGDYLRCLEVTTALCEVRTHELIPLTQRLEGLIQKPDADPDMR